MKRKLLTLGLALLCGSAAYSQQNYHEYNSVGAEPYIDINSIPQGYSVIMTSANGNINDKLSAKQTLPFDWYFYGQKVRNFKVSDNGYITFDPNATISVPENTATLPDSTAPKNAIFAFWDDLQVSNFDYNGRTYGANVFTWTYGAQPNRTVVIFWYQLGSNALAPSANNLMYVALRIHEGGGFDVVNSLNSGNFSATIGATNADGSLGVVASGSPNIGSTNIFTNGYDGGLSPVYNFTYGSQKVHDLGVSIFGLNKTTASTAQTMIQGTINNYGSATVTSFDLNYSVDGGTPVTQSVTGVNIASGDFYNFSHSTPWTGATPGAFHTVKVWATNINGAADDSTANDAMQAKTFVNSGITTPKKILLEEGTGGWCGWCPVGHLFMREMLETYGENNIIPVSIHNGDGMAFTTGNALNSRFTTSYPYMMVDRFSFKNLYGGVANGNVLDSSYWSGRVRTRMATSSSPVKVDVLDKEVDASGNVVITVKATFVDYAAGDLRMNCYITENNVRGPNIQQVWTQHNYCAPTSANVTSLPLNEESEWLPGYKHQHVLRAIPSGTWGTANVIPAIAKPGDSYTFTYKYKLPTAPTAVSYAKTVTVTDPLGLTSLDSGAAMDKVEDMSIVAFVSYYDAADLTNNEILNAYQTPLLGWATGLNEIAAKNVADVQVYPNPTNSQTVVNINLVKGTQANVTVMNELGQKVETLNNGFMQAGANKLSFDASRYTNGVYFLNINTGSESITHRFVVVK